MNFISKVRDRDDFAKTPLGRAIHLAATVGSPMGVCYRKLVILDANLTFISLDAIKRRVTIRMQPVLWHTEASTRALMYILYTQIMK